MRVDREPAEGRVCAICGESGHKGPDDRLCAAPGMTIGGRVPWFHQSCYYYKRQGERMLRELGLNE